MPHPQMFAQDDPLLARLREVALALPGAQERITHGRPWFFVKTGFAMYSGHRRGATGGVGQTEPHCVLVKVDPAEREALLADDRFFEPAYLWNKGWLGLLLEESTDWTEVAELVQDSWRLTAPRRLVKELEADDD